MNVFLTIRVALRALSKNALRAGLTILGVVIGIAAVTTMVSIGQSASGLVQGQLESLGTNMIMIMPNAQRQRVRTGYVPTLFASDAHAITAECPSILATSPIVGTGAQIVFRSENWSPRDMYGVGQDYLMVGKWSIRAGGFFTDHDVMSASKVCVLGHTVAARLFQTRNPIEQSVRIRGIPFRVIGVLQAKGGNMVGQDQDDIVLMPYTTVRKRLHGSGWDDVHAIVASARSDKQILSAKEEINQLLLERHNIPPGEAADFHIQTMNEISDMLGVITGTMTLMLSSIAGISLIVGGVGIMNIMLVSVTERTREIGIRMAVGARGKDILRQFLVEAVLLSCIGGIIGFALGVAASAGVTTLINSFTTGTKWPVIVSLPGALVAILFSGAVGIFFGYYPARRASRLDPIDALRYE